MMTRETIEAIDGARSAWRVGGLLIGPRGEVGVRAGVSAFDPGSGEQVGFETDYGELSRDECAEAAFVFSTLAKTGHLPEHVYCGEEGA